MKKAVLFLSFVMCVSLVGAQNFYNAKKNPRQVGQKTAKITNHIAKKATVVKSTKEAIPSGYARVTLIADDVWGDGSGYQMLIDSNATAYGTTIPATGALNSSGDADSATYAVFEWKIPANADGSLSTTNMLCGTSASIYIPAGTYDYCITNPTPGDRVWIATNGRADNYTFESGKEYQFHVALNGQNDYTTVSVLSSTPFVDLTNFSAPLYSYVGNNDTVTLSATNLSFDPITNVPLVCQVTDPSNTVSVLNATIDTIASGATKIASFVVPFTTEGNYTLMFCSANDTLLDTVTCYPAASLSYGFASETWPDGWMTYNLDGNEINSNVAAYFSTTDGWELYQTDEDGNDHMAISTSYFTTAATADRWLCTSLMSLPANSHCKLQFYASSASASYPESMEVRVSPNGGYQTTDYTTTLMTIDEVGGDTYNYIADLSAYAGTSIRIAFRLTTTDGMIGMLDDVKILGAGAVEVHNSGLANVNSSSSISIYPNPTTSFVTVSNAKGATVKVIDVMGRVVMQQVMNSDKENLSTKDLQNGVYMLQMINNGQVSSQKLIKK